MSSVYFRKENITKKDSKNYIKSYVDKNYEEGLYEILARYMIAVHGTTPSALNKKELYPFFSTLLNTDVANNSRSWWLCQLARIIERNQHKQFDLVEEVKKQGVRNDKKVKRKSNK